MKPLRILINVVLIAYMKYIMLTGNIFSFYASMKFKTENIWNDLEHIIKYKSNQFNFSFRSFDNVMCVE